MKKDIDFIHVHCRGHQDLKHVYYILGDTTNEQRKNYISIFLLNIIYYYENLANITPIIALICSYVAPKTGITYE